MSQSKLPASFSQKYVMGLMIEGAQLQPQPIQIDSKFEKCPIAHAAGIPLYVKRLLNVKAKKYTSYIIVRMMSQPSVGLAPFDWQYGGLLPPAPPVLVARSDSIQFGLSDWQILDDFEMEMLDDGPREVTRKDFIQFVKEKFSDSLANIVLEVLYPKGKKFRVDGLVQKVELNGKIGTCNGIYQKQRIGVSFEDLPGSYAIQPKNLQILEQKKDPQQTKKCDNTMLPPVISVEIDHQKVKLWLEQRFYSNHRLAIYAFDYPQLYDVITYNLPDVDLAFNQVIVPVSDRHEWKLQLLKLTSYFEDTHRRLKSSDIDCQIWRIKKMSEAHHQCIINGTCTCQKQK